jgi:hypothetical protein
MRFLITLILAIFTAFPAFSEERDVHDYLLNLFMADVSQLSDFDPELCTETGTYILLSTDGVWSCADPADNYGTLDLDDGTALLPSLSFANDPDTGIFLSSDGVVGITNNGVGRYYFTSTYLQTEPIRATTNAVGEPAFTFLSDPNTGIYQATAGDDDIDFTSGGVHAGTLNATVFTPTGVIAAADGSSAAPSYTFASDTTLNTGLFWTSENVFRASTGGSAKQEWNASSVKLFDNLFVIDGTVSAPAIAFSNDTDTGIYLYGANSLGVSVGGTSVGYFDASGLNLPGATGVNGMTEAMMDTVSMADGDVDEANAQHVHEVLLFRTERTLVSSDAGTGCLVGDRYGYLNLAACTNYHTSAIYIPEDYHVTRIVLNQMADADVGSKCEIFVEDDAATGITGAPTIQWDADSGGNRKNFPFAADFDLTEGTYITFRVAPQATYTCTGTLIPIVQAFVYGYLN